MDIKQEKDDLKKRKEKVVEEINQIAEQQQQLGTRMRELIKEADMLNGENRILKRLDGEQAQKP